MSGISDKAIKTNYAENKYRFNKGNELQNKEFSDGSGLEWYDAVHRMYDPQIGRFMQMDPKADEENQESWDDYQFGYDDPILYNDPNGECPFCIIPILIGLLLVSEPAAGPSTNHSNAVKENQAINSAHNNAALQAAGSLLTGGAKTFVEAVKTVVQAKQESAAKDNTRLNRAEERANKLSQKDRSGKDFTQAGKDAVKDVNKAKNDESMKCENCGKDVNNASKHESGKTPPDNEAHVDHINPKSNGGSGTPNNGQVLCRSCNLDKGAKPPPPKPPTQQ